MKKTTLLILALAPFLSPRCAAEESPIALFLDARASGDRRQYEKTAKILLEDARKNLPLQQFLIAVVSSEPDAPQAAKITEEERRKFFELSKYRILALAQKNNNPAAWYLLSLEKNDAGMLKRAADLDEVHALNEIGVRRLEAARKLPERDKRAATLMREAFGCFSRAATKTDSNAFYNLGLCYLYGWGNPADVALAMENFRLAAAQGHPKAMSRIGEMYRDGNGAEKDHIQAVRYFLMASNAQNAEGQYNYANALLAGDGVEKNPARAVDLLKKSATQGKVEAMDAYARCICDNVGFPLATNGMSQAVAQKALEKYRAAESKRRAEAFSIWRFLASNKKYPPAMDSLGECYMKGYGTEKDERLGYLWFKRSADRGHIPAMIHLAECWDEGRGGVVKNHHNANWWRTNAEAAKGDRNALVWLGTHKLQ